MKYFNRITTITLIALFGCINLKASNDSSNSSSNTYMMGSNPRTYAPIAFQPSDQFLGPNMIGNYFAAAKIATIHNPLGTTDTCNFKFSNVMQDGINNTDLIFIGSYEDNNNLTINLYGKLEE